jgi:hypothetical protein
VCQWTSAPLFGSVRVCEKVVAGGTKNIQLGGKTLPLPGQNIRKIVVLGDTGCRETTQKCDDNHWPFKALAAQAATAAPDLVIHVIPAGAGIPANART